MPRRRTLLVCSIVALAVTARAADDGEPQTFWGLRHLPEQWQRSVPESEAVRLPSPITRDDRFESVTLKQAIAIALENNPGIAARRLEPELQEAGILGAQAQYDPVLGSDLRSEQSRTANQNALAGAQDTVVIDDRAANAYLSKRFRTSTELQIDFLNTRIDNNSSFTRLRPAYEPTLRFSVVQPLLRDFGWNFTYLVVRVAEERADAARFQYEADLADFVARVIAAYWGVVRARENLEVQRESLALAERTVSENEARVRVGLLAPVATLEARADAKAREEQVILAENDLVVTRQRLAQLAFYRPADTFVPRTLEPLDDAEPEDVEIDLDGTLAEALEVRPEVRASARGVHVQVLNERIASNRLLPRLDIVGSYGLTGLSGRNAGRIERLTDTPIDGADCTQISVTPPVYNCVLDSSPFAGPRSDAYELLRTNEYRTYSFGLTVEVPLSNALARSDFTQAKIARTQAELRHRELLSQITLEVREAVADVVSSRQRIDTSRVARELAEENLRNQEKRHEVGLATTKDLLDFQTRLTSARAAEVQAKTDYAISLARWRRSEGQLLLHYQIVMDEPARRGTPWFAKF